MFDNNERELKIMLTREQYDQILHSYDFSEPVKQVNTYYDMPDDSLRSRLAALRIRQIGSDNILTLKLPKDEITKYEYEIPVHTLDIHQLNPEEWKTVSDHISDVDQKSLVPIASSTTVRRIAKLKGADLCLDQTSFGHVTDYELEYEYSYEHDGIAAFNQILKPLGLHYTANCESKIRRAIRYNSNL